MRPQVEVLLFLLCVTTAARNPPVAQGRKSYSLFLFERCIRSLFSSTMLLAAGVPRSHPVFFFSSCPRSRLLFSLYHRGTANRRSPTFSQPLRALPSFTEQGRRMAYAFLSFFFSREDRGARRFFFLSGHVKGRSRFSFSPFFLDSIISPLSRW